MESRFIREARLQERVNGKIRCNACERRCLLVAGGTGWCRTRQNRGGRLVTLIYGSVSSLAPNPIEKKPFYHFYPGSQTLTVGSWSCNFGCPWCQNWSISKVVPPSGGNYLSPERFVELTIEHECQGTSISFNEPALSLEWALDIFPKARARGLYNTFVTNGYITPEALDLLLDAGLDALNVDIKGDNAAVRQYGRGIDAERVWQTCRRARARGAHLEVTTLVVPTVNDKRETLEAIAARIKNELGPDVPWHVSGYFPAYRFTAPPTPMRTLVDAWQMGRDAGLDFVYTGNLPGHRCDNTLCPRCSEMLIRRLGYEILSNTIRDGYCPTCGVPIAGVWERTLKHAQIQEAAPR